MTGARSHSGTKTDKSQDHSPSVTQKARLPSKRQHKKPRTNRGRYPQGTTHASKVAAVLIPSSRFSNQTGRVSASRGPRCNKYCTVLMKEDCISQKRKKSMWDDICVPSTERMLTKFGKNVPYLLHELTVPMWDDISVPFCTRRMRMTHVCLFIPRVSGCHVGWHFCPFH